jgi:hypothetical protein
VAHPARARADRAGDARDVPRRLVRGRRWTAPPVATTAPGAALTFQSPWAFAGAEYVRAFGYNAPPELVSDALGAWASAYVYQPWVGLLAKYDHIRQDLATAGSQVHVVTAAVFGDLFGYNFAIVAGSGSTPAINTRATARTPGRCPARPRRPTPTASCCS